MSTKLFTIGDSIAQGFMSGAAARTELSFSTLIARKMNLSNYLFPVWEAGGLPLNMEDVFRALNKRYGSNISGLEWLTFLPTINKVIDTSEEYYERGPGRANLPYPGKVNYFHNVAVRGFDVTDSWKVTPEVAWNNIDNAILQPGNDKFLAVADATLYRTALKVLSPSLARDNAGRFKQNFSQLDWLQYHSQKEGVENVCLWLGSNNALGTIVDLQIRQTPGDKSPVTKTHDERIANRWNLWHPTDFAVEYEEMLQRVHTIMSNQPEQTDWKVFLANVPLVTIAPLAKGVGPTTHIAGKGTYYKYYTYVPFDENFAVKTGRHLNLQQVLYIDDCIREYNIIINRLVNQFNTLAGGKPRYFVVDMCSALQDMAWKRNDAQPTYKFPDYFSFVYPKVDTKYYHADKEGQLKQGGLFSLDGVHPSAIGQGLVATEFIKVMQAAGVKQVSLFTDQEWEQIFKSDTLYSRPISLMGEIYEHTELAQFVVQAAKFLNRS